MLKLKTYFVARIKLRRSLDVLWIISCVILVEKACRRL